MQKGSPFEIYSEEQDRLNKKFNFTNLLHLLV